MTNCLVKRLKKVIILAIILTLFPNLEISAFETLFPEPELNCPYHSYDTEPDSIYAWREHMYEIDENLVDENVGSKSFLVGEWVHKKYWDGHWECVPFEKSWLYDYYNSFGWPKEEPLTFEEISLPPQEELRSGPVKRSNKETPAVFGEILKFRFFKTHFPIFTRLYNAAKKNLVFSSYSGKKKEYSSSDYSMVLKYILKQAANERLSEHNLTKLFEPNKISMMTSLIDLNNLRTPIYFYNDAAMEQFKTSYNTLKLYSKFNEEENFQSTDYYLAENLYFIACKLFRSKSCSHLKEPSCKLLRDLLDLIPEECWRTVSIQ